MARVLQFTNTTALGASATFTGEWIDGQDARRLTGYVYTDQAGSLYFEHSTDKVTARRSAATAVAASTLVKYDETFAARYVRVVYINGATAQTAFDINGYLSPV